MAITDVQTQVEEIAQALVMLDPADTAGMATIGNQLGDLARHLAESGHDQAGAIARGAAAVAEGCAGQAEVPAAVSATVNQALEALQDLLENPTLASAPEPAPPAVEAAAGRRPEGLTLSPLVDDAIVAEFLGRQSDSLTDMEKLMLAIEAGDDAEAFESLKRWFHTLKGESGLLGLSDIATVCHATEDMIQAEPVIACVDRLLAVKDWLQATFDYLTDRGPQPESADVVMAQLAAASVPAAPFTQAAPTEACPEPVEVPEPMVSPPAATAAPLADVELPDYTNKCVHEGDVGLLQDFIGEATEHLDNSEAQLLTIEADPHAMEALNAVFRAFHTIKGLAGFAELDHIQSLAHRAENLLDMGRKGELELRGLPMDLVFESVDMMKRLVEGVVVALAGAGFLELEPQLPNLLARLEAVTSGELPVALAPAVPAPQPQPQPQPEPEPIVSPGPETVVGKSGFVPLANMKKRAPAPAATPAPAVEPTVTAEPDQDDDDAVAGPVGQVAARGGTAAGVKVKEAMRVDAERLDRLIETIGEMVIAESMVSQNPEIRAGMSVKLARDLDHLDKISRELQEIGMSLRMVPVRPVFQKMARLVRDLAKKTNRKVEFVMAGEDTELDKNVVDKIGDPLVHMVRNAVDHGLEPTAADRRAAGKSEVGRIELRAFHKGGNICIEIQDDGRGLPREKIIAKAIERGLIREGDVLSDREIHNLIFEAGFSTAQKVTDISGRGVGMDVVRRNIEELRGTCEISSEPGKGSTFSIKLPLTLAIIEGMVISCGPEHYIVPTLSVVRLVRPSSKDIFHVFDRGEMLAFENEHLPLFRLGRLFNVAAAKSDPAEAVVVVVEDEGRKVGLLADDLLGQQSIVIKSLGEAMQNTEGVAGGAIMSNGNVALILDVAGLIRAAQCTTTTGARAPVNTASRNAADA